MPKGLGLDVASTAQAFDTRYHQLTGFHLDELSPIPYAKDVKVPTLVAQVSTHANNHTRPLLPLKICFQRKFMDRVSCMLNL